MQTVANANNQPCKRSTMGGGRSTDPEINVYLAHLIAEETRRGTTLTELARRSGLTVAHLSTLRSRTRGAGWKTLQGLAKALSKSISQIEAEAAQYAMSHPDALLGAASRSARLAADRYPNRALAAEFARRSGISEEAIQLVESELLDAKTDPTPLYWLRKIEMAVEELQHKATAIGTARELDQRASDVQEALNQVKPRMPAKRTK